MATIPHAGLHAKHLADVESGSTAKGGGEWSLVLPLAVTFLLMLAVVCGLFHFAYPRADDLLRAHFAAAIGLRAAVASDYINWSGRWAGIGMGYVLAGTPNLERAYPWFLLGLAATIVLSLRSLVSSAFAGSRSPGARWLLAVAIFVLYWTGSPSLSEAFYWLTGSIENQFSVALGIALLASLIKSGGREKPDRPARIGALVLLAAFCTGFHELFGAVLSLIVCTGTVLAFRWRLPARYTWTACAVTSLVGVALVLVAPGNVVRLRYIYPPGHPGPDNWESFKIGVRYIGGFWLRCILDPKLLLATLLALISPPYASANPFWVPRGSRRRWWLVFPALTVALAGITLAAAWYAQGGLLPGRALSGVYLYFLVGWLATAFLLGRLGQEERGRVAALGLRFSVLALWCLSLLATGNFPQAATDLVRNAWPYEMAMRRRYELIHEGIARGEKDIRLPPLSVVPPTLGFNAELVTEGDVTNPAGFVNLDTAMYFGLRSIAVQPPASRK